MRFANRCGKFKTIDAGLSIRTSHLDHPFSSRPSTRNPTYSPRARTLSLMATQPANHPTLSPKSHRATIAASRTRAILNLNSHANHRIQPTSHHSGIRIHLETVTASRSRPTHGSTTPKRMRRRRRRRLLERPIHTHLAVLLSQCRNLPRRRRNHHTLAAPRWPIAHRPILPLPSSRRHQPSMRRLRRSNNLRLNLRLHSSSSHSHTHRHSAAAHRDTTIASMIGDDGLSRCTSPCFLLGIFFSFFIYFFFSSSGLFDYGHTMIQGRSSFL